MTARLNRVVMSACRELKSRLRNLTSARKLDRMKHRPGSGIARPCRCHESIGGQLIFRPSSQQRAAGMRISSFDSSSVAIPLITDDCRRCEMTPVGSYVWCSEGRARRENHINRRDRYNLCGQEAQCHMWLCGLHPFLALAVLLL